MGGGDNFSTIVALPDVSNRDRDKYFFENLVKKINEKTANNRFYIPLNKIKTYSTSSQKDSDSFEKLGIATIQDAMTAQEVEKVTALASGKHLDQNNYLLKDGSLEYKVDKIRNNENALSEFQSKFEYVVGVSKSFNLENCKDKHGRNNSNMVATLPLFHRTPVAKYSSERLRGMLYAIWYLRVRDAKYSPNPFCGVLKIEKILATDKKQKDGLDSEEVDLISANLINERLPTCYGVDKRWANHLYPVFVTETYAKSKYLSDEMFLSLF